MNLGMQINDSYKEGWQDSEMSTKYVYLRLHTILNSSCIEADLSHFYDQVAQTYYADTGSRVGDDLAAALRIATKDEIL